MRWTGVLMVGSAFALVAAVTSQLLGWSNVRVWFLLAWTVLLLPVLIGLFWHPMRWPAWGLFVGFWGAVGALFLTVLQILALLDWLREPAYGAWVAWPLAIVGVWIVVASGLGFGDDGIPRVVDGLGILTGVGLLAISVITWADVRDASAPAAMLTAIAYSAWAAYLGVVFWRRSPTPSDSIVTAAA